MMLTGMTHFVDRSDAGRQLARRLEYLRGQDIVVLGLPRGGVPVAFEVAQALTAPMDVLVIRKLGVPLRPELAFGAIGEDTPRVVNDPTVRAARLSAQEVADIERKERSELHRQIDRFRHGRERVPLAGRIAVIVDDGVWTGTTAKAACQVARAQGARKVVVAVPVGPPDLAQVLNGYADELVCLETRADLRAVRQAYDVFSPTSDDEVVRLNARAGDSYREAATGIRAHDRVFRDAEIRVDAGPVQLAGRLTIPERAQGMVVFAHGSGSSRHSPRNRFVASVLNDARLATLLLDLLTPAEEVNRANVFDIGLLAERLVEVAAWLARQVDTAALPIGYFGASTGAGAALRAAADPRVKIEAVVSRGGRPDLAGGALADVRAPTLLIVGGRDDIVLELNRQAQAAIHTECRLVVVPGATHLFEEPGTLEQVAELACHWFVEHLSAVGATP
jgi:putative phosphoribosyl transferase